MSVQVKGGMMKFEADCPDSLSRTLLQMGFRKENFLIKKTNNFCPEGREKIIRIGISNNVPENVAISLKEKLPEMDFVTGKLRSFYAKDYRA